MRGRDLEGAPSCLDENNQDPPSTLYIPQIGTIYPYFKGTRRVLEWTNKLTCPVVEVYRFYLFFCLDDLEFMVYFGILSMYTVRLLKQVPLLHRKQ